MKLTMNRNLLNTYFHVLLPTLRQGPTRNTVFHRPTDHSLIPLLRSGCKALFSSISPQKSQCLELSSRHFSNVQSIPVAARSVYTAKGANLVDGKGVKEDKSPVIMIIDRQDKVSVTTLMKAGKMAVRRDLKLVKVNDPTLKTSGREVYKLMTGKEYFEEEVKNKPKVKSPSTKGEKVMTISSSIAPNDLKAKISNINKWLNKGIQIKVTITSKGEKEDQDNVFQAIQKEVESVQGRILQQREKFNSIKFYIAPYKEGASNNIGTSETSPQEPCKD